MKYTSQAAEKSTVKLTIEFSKEEWDNAVGDRSRIQKGQGSQSRS